MKRVDAIRKIKACLRRAASPHANEAAMALRQAQAMMREYGVTAAEVGDVEHADVLGRGRAEPPQSQLWLANLCAVGFGCKLILSTGWPRMYVRFYGVDGAAEIAAYSFTVLRRQLDHDRRRHIARIRKRANRDARGEAFALAWVHAISVLFPQAQLADAKRDAIEQAVNTLHPKTSSTTGRDLTKKGKTREDDYMAGRAAGLNAKLRTGVRGTEQKQLEAF